MPSPKDLGHDRRFEITFKDGQTTVIEAPNRDKARTEAVQPILKARPDFTFKEARTQIATCRILPEDQLKRGPRTSNAKPRSEDDHTVPQW